MARKRKLTPSYLKHPSGRARAVWTDATGVRNFEMLPGGYGSEESRAAFARLQLRLTVGGDAPAADDTTVNELCNAHLAHAEQHYRRTDGTHTHELDEYKIVYKLLRVNYGDTLAAEFGPLSLKAIRHAMFARDWCRTLINQRIGRIRRIWKWGASEERIPVATYQALVTVTGLQCGRTPARESEPILPVDDVTVDATLPLVSRHIRGMIELQRSTGMRPGEVCLIRPADIDMTGDVWMYRPAHHKLAYKNKSRVIAIGPKAQAVLKQFTPANPADYYFSPRASVEAFHRERTAHRETPKYRSHMKRNENRKKGVKRMPQEKYTTASYGRAISKAITRTNEAGKLAAKKAGAKYTPITHWHPNQLRHSFATRVRKEHGLEAAQVSLGHSRADVTQIYAERNQSLAVDVAAKIG